MTVPEHTVHYVEIVTPDVEDTRDLYEKSHGWHFQSRAPELGDAFVANTPGGSLCGIRAPQFDFSNGQLIVPHPPTSREEIQEPFVREQQIDPKLYYPEGYCPELLEDWAVDDDLVVPLEALPDSLKDGMGAQWRLTEKNKRVLEEQSREQ